MNPFLRPPPLLTQLHKCQVLVLPRQSRKDAHDDWLEQWNNPDTEPNAPKAQFLGALTSSIIWIVLTFLAIVPILGFLSQAIPVPGAVFRAAIFAPILVMLYILAMVALAPIKSRSAGWVFALSWPMELMLMLCATCLALL